MSGTVLDTGKRAVSLLSVNKTEKNPDFMEPIFEWKRRRSLSPEYFYEEAGVEVEVHLASGVLERIWRLVGMRSGTENRGMDYRSAMEINISSPAKTGRPLCKDIVSLKGLTHMDLMNQRHGQGGEWGEGHGSIPGVLGRSILSLIFI